MKKISINNREEMNDALKELSILYTPMKESGFVDDKEIAGILASYYPPIAIYIINKEKDLYKHMGDWSKGVFSELTKKSEQEMYGYGKNFAEIIADNDYGDELGALWGINLKEEIKVEYANILSSKYKKEALPPALQRYHPEYNETDIIS
jgi:hypothetical protein